MSTIDTYDQSHEVRTKSIKGKQKTKKNSLKIFKGMKLKRNKKAIKNVNPSQSGLTYQTCDVGYETRITPQKYRTNYKV
jgi:FKBP-type peptidyl-prolyl cis-trans isomerase